jgi:hypothetical protein
LNAEGVTLDDIGAVLRNREGLPRRDHV